MLASSTVLAGQHDPGSRIIEGRYIVTLNRGPELPPGAIDDLVSQLKPYLSGEIISVYRHTAPGFVVEMTESAAEALRSNPNVRSVTPDIWLWIDSGGIQSGPDWGLDRIDQRDLPLDDTFEYGNSAPGFRIYVIDTGIRRTHNDFGGRAEMFYDHFGGDDGAWCSSPPEPPPCPSCTLDVAISAHGTHVAGLAAGATYGISKSADIRDVRVFNCAGGGALSWIRGGIDAIASFQSTEDDIAIANMSFGADVDDPDPGDIENLEIAITQMNNQGVLAVAAAGNAGIDACERTPARMSNVLTVGGTRLANNDSEDRRIIKEQTGGNVTSNYGSCVDLFAPGYELLSATDESDSSFGAATGTSMATPLAAGVAALHAEATGPANITPAQLRQAVIDQSTKNKITQIGIGSPNRLLYSWHNEYQAPPPPPPQCPYQDEDGNWIICP
jgi:subtilisin family serine protease